MSRVNKLWQALHTLSTYDVAEIPSEDLKRDHKAIDRILRAHNLKDVVKIGKDSSRKTLVLSKNLKH